MKVYQIYYDDNSHNHISPLFTPYDNTHPNRGGEFEYGVMRKVYQEHDWSQDSHLGVVSWKIFDKIEHLRRVYHDAEFILNRDSLVKDIEDSVNEGYDIVFVNPWPFLSPNVWAWGECCHPGIIDRAEYILSECNVSNDMIHDLIHVEQDTDTQCYCNYWIANKKFWDVYMSVTEPMYEVYVKEGIDHYFPYIMERMFSSILFNRKDEFKVSNKSVS